MQSYGSAYLLVVSLMTALVASDLACLPISPGSSKLTEVWISLEVMVGCLFLRAKRPASGDALEYIYHEGTHDVHGLL